jgi:hypothetical protein
MVNLSIYLPHVISIAISVLILLLNISHVLVLTQKTATIAVALQPIDKEPKVSTYISGINEIYNNLKSKLDKKQIIMRATGTRHYEHDLIDRFELKEYNRKYSESDERITESAVKASNYNKTLVNNFNELYSKIYNDIKSDIDNVENLIRVEILKILDSSNLVSKVDYLTINGFRADANVLGKRFNELKVLFDNLEEPIRLSLQLPTTNGRPRRNANNN